MQVSCSASGPSDDGSRLAVMRQSGQSTLAYRIAMELAYSVGEPQSADGGTRFAYTWNAFKATFRPL